MKIPKNKPIGIAKIFPRYETFVEKTTDDNISDSLDFILENYNQIFQHSYCQIDVFDSEGNILLTNARHYVPEDDYNILQDQRLDYVDIQDKFSEVMKGNIVYLPAIEYFINATEAIWLEMKLMPVSKNEVIHIVCLSYDISRYKRKEFEYMKHMANNIPVKTKKNVDLMSDHIAFLKYFIKILPIDLAIYNHEKKILCSNYKPQNVITENTFQSQLVPKNTKMHQFDYLGNKLYIKIKEPLTNSLTFHDDILCITDLDGTILDVSESIESHLGESKNSLIGHNILKYYQYPKDRDSLIKRVLKEKSISGVNLALKNKDGKVKRRETNIKLVESDNKTFLVSSLRDSEFSRNEIQKTYRSEELLQETQRFSKTGSWSFDLLTSEFMFSAELERIFELTQPCQCIKCLTRAISIKDKVKTLRFFANLKTSDELQKLECKIITANCTNKILYSEGKLERDYYGNPKRIVGFTQDISELRQYEEEKDDAKSEIDSLYNSIPTMLLNTDSKCRITAVSKFLLDKLGYCKTDITEKYLNELILDQGMPFKIIEIIDTTTLDADIISRSGNLLHVRMTIAPRFENDLKTGYTIVLTDISDKVELNKQLQTKTEDLESSVESKNMTLTQTIKDLKSENDRNRKLQSQLVRAQLELSKSLESEQESGELKSRFIDMISHEYRTPLTVIMSSAYIIERLADMANESKINKHIDKIIKASNAMTGLLDSTLDMVFHNKGDYTFVPALFNVQHCIEKVIREIEIIDGHNHKIIYKNSIVEPTLYTDLRLCRLSFYNILMNAVKYSDIDTEIIVISEEVDEQITISVKDHGCGIPECDAPMIYTPFYRGSQTGGLVPGTGLGLTVTKQCIAKINGSVTYETEENFGTTFYLKFPRRFVMKSRDNSSL